MSEWISVKDEREIPVTTDTFLVVDDGEVKLADFMLGHISDSYGDRLTRVTHWQPLPEPPKD